MTTYIYLYIEEGKTYLINCDVHDVDEALDIALENDYIILGEVSNITNQPEKEEIEHKHIPYGKASYRKVLFSNVGDIPVNEDFNFQGQRVRMVEREYNGENWVVTLIIIE